MPRGLGGPFRLVTGARLGAGDVKALGSIYVWVPTPGGKTSAEFATELLDEAAVVVAPGTGYGPNGEGFVRFSLTAPDERIEEAMRRIREHMK